MDSQYLTDCKEQLINMKIMVKMINLLMFLSIFSQCGCKAQDSYSAVTDSPVPPKVGRRI